MFECTNRMRERRSSWKLQKYWVLNTLAFRNFFHKNWVLICKTYLFQGETDACYRLAAVERRQQPAWMLGGCGLFCSNMPNCNFIGYCSSDNGAKLSVLKAVATCCQNNGKHHVTIWTDWMCLHCEYRSLVFSTVCKALALSVAMHLLRAGRPIVGRYVVTSPFHTESLHYPRNEASPFHGLCLLSLNHVWQYMLWH